MEEARELRAELNRERAGHGGKGKRGFSVGLRRRVVEFLRGQRAQGKGVDELVEAVGLSRPTYYAWLGAAKPRTGKFRQLAVVAKEPPASPSHCNSEGRIVVMGPGRVTVVGMSASDVAELFRRLGC